MTRRPRKPRASLLYENTLLAFESLRDRGTRSFLTVLGVFIGVVIIIGVASVLNGFRSEVIDRFEQFGANNIYIVRMPMVRLARPTADERRRRHLTLHDARAVQDHCPDVVAVSPVKFMPPHRTSVRRGAHEMLGPNVRGVFASMSRVMSLDLGEGRFFTEEENRRRVPVCVIGVNVADALFPGVSPLGRPLSLEGRRLRVVGVMAKFADAPFGGEAPEDSMLFIPFNLFEQVFPRRREVAIAARARTGRIDEAVAQVEAALRWSRRVPARAPNDFEIGTSSSLVAAFDKIVFAALAVMFALSTVAFLVGGVGVMNVMLASVRERTREIGVRRALGARRRDIVWQFLAEASAMTGVGGVAGVLVGEALMAVLAALFPALPSDTPLWARLFGFFGSVGVGIVFGLWPAVVAARLDPIGALRYE